MKKSIKKPEPVPFSPSSSFQISFPIIVSKKKVFTPLFTMIKNKS
jgi:hypothetical protein